MSTENAARTRTDGSQTTAEVCEYCHGMFPPKKRGGQQKRFCKDKCRAAYSRENGLVGDVVVIRRLKTRVSVTFHTRDERILAAPLGARFRLVRESI